MTAPSTQSGNVASTETFQTTRNASEKDKEDSAASDEADRDDETKAKDTDAEKVQAEPSFMERRCGLLFNAITFCNRKLKVSSVLCVLYLLVYYWSACCVHGFQGM